MSIASDTDVVLVSVSVTTSWAVRSPPADGVIVTQTSQRAPAARVAPVQLSLCVEKSPAFVPDSATDATCAPEPPATTVTGTHCAAEPTGVLGQLIAIGSTVSGAEAAGSPTRTSPKSAGAPGCSQCCS